MECRKHIFFCVFSFLAIYGNKECDSVWPAFFVCLRSLRVVSQILPVQVFMAIALIP